MAVVTSPLLGPAPIDAPIVDTSVKSGKSTGYTPIIWSDWFNAIFRRTQSTFSIIGSSETPTAGSSAAIGTTPVTTPTLSAGLYRVAYYLVEIRADNVASTVAVTLGWTDKSTARTLTGPVLAANAVTAAQSGAIMVRIDKSTPITYSTSYTSTGGAPSLLYDLIVTVEQVVTV